MASPKRKCDPLEEHACKRAHVDTEPDGQVDHEIVLDLLEMHLEGQDVDAWCSASGIAPDDDGTIFSTVAISGSVGVDGDPAKMTITALPTFRPYIQRLAEEGGFDDDEDAASEILERILETYDNVLVDIVKDVAEMRSHGDITTSAFAFALDSDGSACNLVIG